MSIKELLQEKIASWNLLNHPFYQAWSAGELPLNELKMYAEDYGAFIASLPQGWKTVGDVETAQEESEHAELWDAFAAGLDTRVGNAKTPEARRLVEEAARLFLTPATALGALYAFEAQQPDTAASKLAGLREYYNLPKSIEPYFEVHSTNHHETQKILASIEALPESQQQIAVEACAAMGKALWDALSGIHGACEPQ